MSLFDGVPTVACETCRGSGQVVSNVDIAETLRAARMTAGISQRTVAKRMGVSSGYVTQLELAHEGYTWTAKLIAAFVAAIQTGGGDADAEASE